LQGFDGIGPELAERIVDHFGRVPLSWTVGEGELAKVKGLGKKKVAKMVKVLGYRDLPV
jgi:ERCC4-type nuclease